MSLKLLEREETSVQREVKDKAKLIIFLVIVIVILSLILGIVILNHRTNKYKAEAKQAKAEVQEMLDEAVLLEKVSKTITTEEIPRRIFFLSRKRFWKNSGSVSELLEIIV